MDWLTHIIQPLSRWLHIVGTALLIGGTLFYEFVVPRAVEDLKDEQQLSVFGKVRWAFRLVVMFAATAMMITGLQQLIKQWPFYTETQKEAAPWAVVHIGTGLLALLIALRLTTTNRVPSKPLLWMRVNLVLLLVCAFFASTTRHVRLTIREDQDALTRDVMREATSARPIIFPTTQDHEP